MENNLKIDGSFIFEAANIIGNTDTGLTGTEIVKFLNSFATKFSTSIPVYTPKFQDFGEKGKNKRTVLYEDLIVFSGFQQFEIVDFLCNVDSIKNIKEVINIRNQLHERYSMFNPENQINNELINKTKEELKRYQKPLNQYNSGLDKFTKGIYERNILDDLRLSLELLVKEILNNNKSLENNANDLSRWLSDKGASVDLIIMIHSFCSSFTNYENHNVKHDDKVNVAEVKYVFEFTSVVIDYLASLNNL